MCGSRVPGNTVYGGLRGAMATVSDHRFLPGKPRMMTAMAEGKKKRICSEKITAKVTNV